MPTTPTLSPDLLALLGTLPDAEIARRAGVSRAAVHGLRTRRGLPAFVPVLRSSPPVTVCFTEADWTRILDYARARGVTPTEAVRELAVRPIGTTG